MATRRELRFKSLPDEKYPETSPVTEFIIFYHGSTIWNDEFTGVEDILGSESSRRFTAKLRPKPTTLERRAQISVDASGAAIYRDDGTTERFNLRRIKEIIYCGNIKKYSKHVILVADCEGDVRAHILVSETVQNAKRLYKTFIRMFTLYDDLLDLAKAEQFSLPSDDMAITSPDEKPKSPCVKTETSQIPTFEDATMEDDAFTVLARSRSVCDYDYKRRTRKSRNNVRHMSLA